MKTLLIILGVLLFICLLPIGARLIMNDDGLRIKLVFGLFQFKLLPRTKLPKEKKAKAKTDKAAKKEQKLRKKLQKREKPKEKKPIGLLIEEYLPLLQLGLSALGNLRWLFVIRRLKVHFCYGGADAGACALNYGKACAAINAGMAVLFHNLRIHRWEVVPEVDYSCTTMRVDADAVVTITLGGVLVFAVRYALKALCIIIRNKKLEKVVQYESSAS